MLPLLALGSEKLILCLSQLARRTRRDGLALVRTILVQFACDELARSARLQAPFILFRSVVQSLPNLFAFIPLVGARLSRESELTCREQERFMIAPLHFRSRIEHSDDYVMLETIPVSRRAEKKRVGGG
jgi:hypothetical protein